METRATYFSHNKPSDTQFESGGLRDFFLYRDLGISKATNGNVIARIVKANEAPEKGTGWHRHEANFHFFYMLKGWAKFMYEGKETLVSAGDCVHQNPGLNRFLFDYSPDVGHKVDYVLVPDDAPIAAMRDAGMDEWTIDKLMSLNRIIAAGYTAAVSPDLSQLIGRAPTSFGRFVADHLDAWR